LSAAGRSPWDPSQLTTRLYVNQASLQRFHDLTARDRDSDSEVSGLPPR